MRTGRLLASLVALLFVAAPAGADWDPARFADAPTLEILTVDPESGEHWSTVWVVVVDGAVYVRLGNRAAGRVEQSTTAPHAKVRFEGEVFERVRLVPSPEKAEAVAEAMAGKYWTDLVIRGIPHPLTLRLEPESPG
jgi:hypothetical protein